MNKSLIIAKKEFLKYIRSKWFRVFLVLPLIGMGILILISSFAPEGFSNLNKKEIHRIGIVDYSKQISEYLENTEKYELIQMDSMEAVEQMWGKNIKGFIVIPQNPDSGEIIYYSSSLNLELWPLREILRKGTIKLKLKENNRRRRKKQRERNAVSWPFHGGFPLYVYYFDLSTDGEKRN